MVLIFLSDKYIHLCIEKVSLINFQTAVGTLFKKFINKHFTINHQHEYINTHKLLLDIIITRCLKNMN